MKVHAIERVADANPGESSFIASFISCFISCFIFVNSSVCLYSISVYFVSSYSQVLFSRLHLSTSSSEGYHCNASTVDSHFPESHVSIPTNDTVNNEISATCGMNTDKTYYYDAQVDANVYFDSGKGRRAAYSPVLYIDPHTATSR